MSQCRFMGCVLLLLTFVFFWCGDANQGVAQTSTFKCFAASPDCSDAVFIGGVWYNPGKITLFRCRSSLSPFDKCGEVSVICTVMAAPVPYYANKNDATNNQNSIGMNPNNVNVTGSSATAKSKKC